MTFASVKILSDGGNVQPCSVQYEPWQSPGQRPRTSTQPPPAETVSNTAITKYGRMYLAPSDDPIHIRSLYTIAPRLRILLNPLIIDRTRTLGGLAARLSLLKSLRKRLGLCSACLGVFGLLLGVELDEAHVLILDFGLEDRHSLLVALLVVRQRLALVDANGGTYKGSGLDDDD
jgi:hypothetical protein